MNLLDGKLFLFKSNLKDAQPGKEGEGGAEVGERVGEGEGGGEEEREIVKGVELSKLLNKKTESPVSSVDSTSVECMQGFFVLLATIC